MNDEKILEIPVSIAGRIYPVLAASDEVENIEFIKQRIKAKKLEALGIDQDEEQTHF